jgi:hypothetical protein
LPSRPNYNDLAHRPTRFSLRGLNAELAETLHMSLPTTKTHVSRILTNLGVGDRTQLVILAYESGLVARPERPAAMPRRRSTFAGRSLTIASACC